MISSKIGKRRNNTRWGSLLTHSINFILVFYRQQLHASGARKSKILEKHYMEMLNLLLSFLLIFWKLRILQVIFPTHHYNTIAYIYGF